MSTLSLTTATTGRRVAAYLIDWVLLMCVTWGGSLALAVALYIVLPEAQADAAAGYIVQWVYLTSVALAFLYFVPCWAIFGRTLGMALCGLHVVQRDDPRLGGVPWRTAAARCLGYFICWPTFGIGFFFRLHDTIAGTDVVRPSRQVAQGYALATWPPEA